LLGKTETLQLVQEFLVLQRQLFHALEERFPGFDRLHLSGLPRRGEIVTQDGFERWTFQVHGTGIRFANPGRSVDLNRNLELGPEVFDAGRIAEYVEVRHPALAELFSYASGDDALAELLASGEIVRETRGSGYCYRLARL